MYCNLSKNKLLSTDGKHLQNTAYTGQRICNETIPLNESAG